MVARAYLVRQALLMMKLARASRNPSFAAFAADKAAKLQARLDELQVTAETPADAPAAGSRLAP